MRRREFLGVLGGAAASWPLAAGAQQAAMPVIGFLRNTTAAGSQHLLAGLRKGLGEAGFVEGQNVAIEYAFSDGRSERLPELAAGLVAKRVSAILTSAANATEPARAATTTIPIIFAVAVDPVARGFVTSLNRPGGNVTGVSYLSSELGGKRLGLVRELVPKAADIAMIANRNNPTTPIFTQDFEAGARILGLRSLILNAATASEIEAAFAVLADRQVAALLVTNDPFFTTHQAQIIALAARHAIPASYSNRGFAEAGGLMSYGSNLPEVYRQVGVYAGRVLKGEKPADLPVLQPTTFELVINLKTAKALGLEISPQLLATADELIE